MRQDARALLEKLQQTEFEYRDFDGQDAEEDGEAWPLLEALSRHPAIARPGPARSWPQRAEAGTKVAATSGNRMFSRYDARPQESDAEPEAPVPSLRGFLNKLAADD